MRTATVGQWVGAILTLPNFYLLITDSKAKELVTPLDVTLHTVGFAFCAFLMYPHSFERVVRALKLRIPFLSR